ncbi:hypothetical protein K488DRAFT_49437 [Vararia minispora EC-137]|uniref:Uncharacterized protein n=1 Tax=Vararia minispora EC-137 TaxID=1314806 RepID=A0ACB8QM05_9AGAM|nr:hypothetical protein K488DRAFT_49437 [Vararia minispora EC-137]
MSHLKTTVLITGCTTGGIGHALAKEFQRKGCMVFATTRNPATMQDLVDDPNFETLTLDVCNPDSIRAAKEEVAKRTGGGLHVLTISPAIDSDVEDVKSVFDLNFFSALRVTNAFVPLLMEAGRTSPAHIFSVGSVAGEAGTTYISAYGSAKAALKAWGNTLRVELAPFKYAFLSSFSLIVSHIVQIITGLVRNSKPAEFIKLRLAPDSVYKPIEDFSTKAFYEANDPNARMPVEDYAQIVVREALKPHPRAHLYAGKHSSVAWFATQFLPLGVMVCLSFYTRLHLAYLL